MERAAHEHVRPGGLRRAEPDPPAARALGWIAGGPGMTHCIWQGAITGLRRKADAVVLGGGITEVATPVSGPAGGYCMTHCIWQGAITGLRRKAAGVAVGGGIAEVATPGLGPLGGTA